MRKKPIWPCISEESGLRSRRKNKQSKRAGYTKFFKTLKKIFANPKQRRFCVPVEGEVVPITDVRDPPLARRFLERNRD
jgi:hypothetical protein